MQPDQKCAYIQSHLHASSVMTDPNRSQELTGSYEEGVKMMGTDYSAQFLFQEFHLCFPHFASPCVPIGRISPLTCP
jgi:hypothetical protein